MAAVLAAAAAPAAAPRPPSRADLVPDPLLVDLLPDDLPALLAQLPSADLSRQDEVAGALHPTLTRVWCRTGRRGQRLVEAPGTNAKRDGCGLVEWRDGWRDWSVAAGRCAALCCAQLRRAVARSAARGRTALVLLDTLSSHTPRGSHLLQERLDEVNADREQVRLVSTPTYDPDRNRSEWLWRALRRAVTHAHTRATLDPLLADANQWAHTLPADQVLRQIGSPFAPDDDERIPVATRLAPPPALVPAA